MFQGLFCTEKPLDHWLVAHQPEYFYFAAHDAGETTYAGKTTVVERIRLLTGREYAVDDLPGCPCEYGAQYGSIVMPAPLADFFGPVGFFFTSFVWLEIALEIHAFRQHFRSGIALSCPDSLYDDATFFQGEDVVNHRFHF